MQSYGKARPKLGAKCHPNTPRSNTAHVHVHVHVCSKGHFNTVYVHVCSKGCCLRDILVSPCFNLFPTSDPPMDPKNIPSGEWLCRRCMSLEVGEEVPSLFRPLLEQAYAANPLIFSIPPELQKNDLLPGEPLLLIAQQLTGSWWLTIVSPCCWLKGYQTMAGVHIFRVPSDLDTPQKHTWNWALSIKAKE